MGKLRSLRVQRAIKLCERIKIWQETTVPQIYFKSGWSQLSIAVKLLRYYADKLDNLIRPTWANSCLLIIKLGELEELVEYHELLGL